MKYSLRDLLFVTVILALAVGWGIEHRERLIALDKFNAVRLWVLDQGWEFSLVTERGNRVEVTLPNSSAPAPNPPKP